MLEIFTYDFMIRGLLAAFFIGGTCSVIGVFVVLMGLSFISAGISHAAFAGVAFAFLLGLNPLLTALISSLIMVWLVGYINNLSELKMDASIGIFFSLTMALAILFIGLMNRYNAELFGYLFGNIIGISEGELSVIITVVLIVIILIWLFLKEFHFITFDIEMAEASGLPVNNLMYLLLTLTAIIIVISLKAVGNLLVVAFIIIPASSAYQITHSIRKMLIFSALLGITGSIIGLVLSFYFNFPSGPGIVLTLAVFFIISLVYSPKRKCKKCSLNDLE